MSSSTFSGLPSLKKAFVFANYLRKIDPNKIWEVIPLFSKELLDSRYVLLVKDRIQKKAGPERGEPFTGIQPERKGRCPHQFE